MRERVCVCVCVCEHREREEANCPFDIFYMSQEILSLNMGRPSSESTLHPSQVLPIESPMERRRSPPSPHLPAVCFTDSQRFHVLNTSWVCPLLS